MKTKIMDWKKEINKKELQILIKILEKDGVIIFPTDTVYGIACNAYSEKAIKRLYEIKNRPLHKPICVLTDSINKIKEIAEITKKEEEIINTYMPGALTIILKKKEILPNILTAGKKTVGVRIPDHEISLTILRNCPFPLATTSANESGEKEKTNIQDVKKEFDKKVDVIIDGGASGSQIASTIIQVEKEKVQVIREGNIKF